MNEISMDEGEISMELERLRLPHWANQAQTAIIPDPDTFVWPDLDVWAKSEPLSGFPAIRVPQLFLVNYCQGFN